MPSIRITRFAGLLPEVSPKLLREDHAQIAHNALLWDGWLRPMPQFNLLNAGIFFVSLFPDSDQPPYGLYGDTDLLDGTKPKQEPYVSNAIFGINKANHLLYYRPTPSTPQIFPLGLPPPTVTVATQIITSTNLSVYPVPRTYAVTYMSGNMEGPPHVFSELGANGGLFEGDIVTLSVTFNAAEVAANRVTAVRIYRTIPGFDTGEQIQNPKETAFHLVTTLSPFLGNSFVYVDNDDSSSIPADLLLTDQFVKPTLPYVNFVAPTESGWLVAAGYTPMALDGFSRIQVSERFLWHSWPTQNLVSIPDVFVDAAVFYDDIFIGTLDRPYHMRIEYGESAELDSLDIKVRPFPDNYKCVSNSMVTTNFGAMYASPDGLVALQVNDDAIATKKVTSPGDQLVNPIATLTIDSISKAAWWNGFYIGFSDSLAYLYNLENNHNNEFPLGQLITFDTPPGVPGPHVVVGSGFYMMWGSNFYNFPLPGYGYEGALKSAYTWKSKKFVMPGLTTFAAAKVVSDRSGTLTFTLIGDGLVRFAGTVFTNDPFRLPHNYKCIEWEILLEGTSVVQEVHVSTSMRELVEEQGHA